MITEQLRTTVMARLAAVEQPLATLTRADMPEAAALTDAEFRELVLLAGERHRQCTQRLNPGVRGTTRWHAEAGGVRAGLAMLGAALNGRCGDSDGDALKATHERGLSDATSASYAKAAQGAHAGEAESSVLATVATALASCADERQQLELLASVLVDESFSAKLLSHAAAMPLFSEALLSKLRPMAEAFQRGELSLPAVKHPAGARAIQARLDILRAQYELESFSRTSIAALPASCKPRQPIHHVLVEVFARQLRERVLPTMESFMYRPGQTVMHKGQAYTIRFPLGRGTGGGGHVYWATDPLGQPSVLKAVAGRGTDRNAMISEHRSYRARQRVTMPWSKVRTVKLQDENYDSHTLRLEPVRGIPLDYLSNMYERELPAEQVEAIRKLLRSLPADPRVNLVLDVDSVRVVRIDPA